MTKGKTMQPRPKVDDNLIMLALETHHADKKDEWNFKDIVDQYCPSKDGYDLMRDLERYCHWDGSRDLMDELDNVNFSVSRTHNKANKDWVAAYNVQPTIEVGEDITFKDKRGKITGIDKPMGRYMVQFYEPLYEKMPCLIGGTSYVCVDYEEAFR